MGKRNQFKPHLSKPDRVYGSTTIWKLINKFMWGGEKGKAERIVYEAAKQVEEWWTKKWTGIHQKSKEKVAPKKAKLKENSVEESESEELLKKDSPPLFSQIWEEKVLPNAEFDLEMVRGKPVKISKDRFLKIFFCWLVEAVRGQKKGRKKNPKKTSEILAEEIIQLSNGTGKMIEKKISVYQAARRAKGLAYSIPSPSVSVNKSPSLFKTTTWSDKFTNLLKELAEKSIEIPLSIDKFKPSDLEGVKKELNHFSVLALKEKLKADSHRLIWESLKKSRSASESKREGELVNKLKEYKFEINSICSRKHKDGRVTILNDSSELSLSSQPYNFTFTVFPTLEPNRKITATTLHNPIFLVEEKK